jgi:23S rRNA (uracil1939-C5)-methyltransferase
MAPSKQGPARGKPSARPTTELLTVDALAAGGAGVARRASGEVVFVPRAAPGDRVEVAVEAGRNPLRGALLRVVEPSPHRIEPACEHVAACGGCDWMHLALEAQEREHAAIVRRAIAHAASIAEADLPEVRVTRAPSPLRYRTRARLHARGERGRVTVGYRAAGSHSIAEVDSCVALDPALEPLLADLRAALAGARGEGDASIALGEGRRPVVALEWRGELAPATFAALDDRVSRGAWAGASVRLEGASRPSVFGDPRPRAAGADGFPLVVADASFAQASDQGAALLARSAAALASRGATRPRHVVELFAGSGTLSVLLAQGAASFTAVEIGAAAAACARENLAARGLAGKVVVADADASAMPPRAEVVVLDPPRTGARGATRAITAGPARVVVYVACDPATLARDAAELLRAGFALTDLETIELFPQTSHVEALVRLERTRGRPR